jgi:SlyX.
VSEEIQRLEEKIAYLEHHVTQQDKAMLELAEEMERLKREVRMLAMRLSQTVEERGGGGASDQDERPPHY